MIADSLLHYEIVEKLGQGGMGIVYKALDRHLDRPVAIKVLPPEQNADPLRRARFVHEAKAASALNHPHIVTIYDIVQEGGADYIVMELLEGETLLARLSRERLRMDEAIDIAIQIARGLDAAHKKGIVHRDIKPANLFLTSSGICKILDFGLARRIAINADTTALQTLTSPGSAVGTVAYMSPEQARGGDIDEGTDLFSFGAVLYEMIARRRAFAGDTAAVAFDAVLNKTPPPLAGLNAECPPALDRIVSKAIQKDRAHRYQTAAEILRDLNTVQSGRHSDAFGPVAMEELSIVVLPFEDISPGHDNAYFADGLTEEVIADLSHVRDLKVISRTSAMSLKATHKDLRTIAGELNVRYALEGSVRKAGNSVRITAQLLDAATDAHLWAEKYTGTLDDVFEIQERVSRAIVDVLKITLTASENRNIGRLPAANVQGAAYEAYVKGKAHRYEERPKEIFLARDYFEQAIRIDPNFALPLAGLAEAYILLAHFEALPREQAAENAVSNARKALELDPASSEARVSMGVSNVVFDWDWKAAETEFRRALELRPNNYDAFHELGMLMFRTYRYNEAERMYMHASRLDPLNAHNLVWLGWLYQAMGKHVEAEGVRKHVETLAPEWEQMWFWDRDWPVEVYTKRIETDGRTPGTLGDLAVAYRRTGDMAAADALLRELESRYERDLDGNAAFGLATVYSRLNDKTKSLDWLERAAERKAPRLINMDIFFLPRLLRDEPRYQAVLKKLGVK